MGPPQSVRGGRALCSCGAWANYTGGTMAEHFVPPVSPFQEKPLRVRPDAGDTFAVGFGGNPLQPPRELEQLLEILRRSAMKEG